MATIYLPNRVGQQYQEYQKRRPKGADPFPNPQTEREEIVHGLWEVGVMVAGWWLHETEQLRDMLHKYQQTQREEAEQMEQDKVERESRAHLQPTSVQRAEFLRGVLAAQKRRRDGVRKFY